MVSVSVMNPYWKHTVRELSLVLLPQSHCAIKEGERMKKFPEKHDARESDDNKWQNKQDRNRDTSASLDKDDKPTMNHCLVTAFDMAHISLQNVIYMISKVKRLMGLDFEPML